ncbi:hypothetical protein QQ045_011702 [Rhodiola kirilowii]
MRSAESYKIIEELQLSEKGATLYKARYIKPEPEAFSGEVMAIKVLNRQRLLENVICLTRDIQHSKRSNHKNVTRVVCSFVNEGDLWVVMRYEHVASLARVVGRGSGGGGLAEREVGYVLREVLEGLDYIHGCKWMHGGFDLRHVFVDSDGGVRIDLGLLAYDPDGKFEDSEAAWAALPPEVLTDERMELKSDVWCFGIVALRLAFGDVPARSYKELAAFLAGSSETVEKEAKTVRKKSGLVRRCGCFSGGFTVDERVEEGEAKKMKMSAAFMKMVADCLAQEASKRPSTKQLMECDFFRKLQSQKTPSFLESLLG